MRVGIVLGGGGTVGYGWHTGVLRGLAEITGIDARAADEVVGTSAGSYAAAYVRAGVSGADLFALAVGDPVSAEGQVLVRRAGRVGELDSPARRSLRPSDPSVLRRAVTERRVPPLGALLGGLLPDGTVSAEPYLGPLRTLFPHGTWPTGLRIAAVRQRDGQRVVFDGSSGVEVAEAVAASSAVPAYMEPVELDGERYVDGSTHAPTNADVLAGAGLDVVVVSAPMSPPAEGVQLARDLPVRWWAARHLRREVQALVRAGTRVVALTPSARSRETMAPSGMSEAIRGPAARVAYQQMLDGGDALVRQLT
ncbi:MAG TPA: patatin-like phospholipase family protein [Mycobacteriales bacterium]